jgi:hypothetical protein
MHDREFEAESRGVELAAELLDVTNEAELERFLGRVVAATARGVGGRLPAGTGRSLVAVLRRTAERTLPTLATLLGDPMGPPAAATSARVYGLELEGMSAEDRDYEIARQFLRFAQSATARAATAPASAAVAVAGAAREYAPGLCAADHSAAARLVSPIRK